MKEPQKQLPQLLQTTAGVTALLPADFPNGTAEVPGKLKEHTAEVAATARSICSSNLYKSVKHMFHRSLTDPDL